MMVTTVLCIRVFLAEVRRVGKRRVCGGEALAGPERESEWMVLGGQKESDFGTRVLVGCYMERQSRAKARGSPGIVSWGLGKRPVLGAKWRETR